MPTSTNVLVSAVSKKPHLIYRHRKRLMVVGAVLIVVGAAAVVFFMNRKSSPAMIVPEEAQIVGKRAETLKYSGKASEAKQVLEQALKDNKDARSQAYYGLQLATMYESEKNYQEALNRYKVVYKLNVTGISVAAIPSIARCAEALGDKATALEYYKLAYANVDRNVGGYESRLKLYQTKVTALGGSL